MKKRIAITGFSIESSTFSPYINGENDFVVYNGEKLLDWYPFLKEAKNSSLLKKNIEWVLLSRARSIPGGVVDKNFYKKTKKKIISELKNSGHLDGLLLDIHGAMSVQGMDDAEYDFVKDIRKIVGNKTLISATMDLHGNVSKELIEKIDLITCYRTAPHIDDMITKKRAAVNLIKQLSLPINKRKPYKAWLPIPVLLPGEKTSTRLNPAKTLYEQVSKTEAKKNILDVALFVGYAWADQPRCRAYVIVTGNDKKLIKNEATKLGQKYWDNRDKFKFVGDALSLQNCLLAANKHIVSNNKHKPFVISDSGDNPTAGGAGDVTWTLNELLTNPLMKNKSAIFASLFDTDAVKKCVKAGVGSTIKVTAGANIDNIHSKPAILNGTVYNIYKPSNNIKNTGNYSADSIAYGGIEVVVKVNGIHIIITEKRKPYHHRNDFVNLNLIPEKFDLLFVKIGYLEPELFKLSDNGKYWKLGLTPGGVDQDLLRLGHKKILPKTFPFYIPSKNQATQIKKNLIAKII